MPRSWKTSPSHEISILLLGLASLGFVSCSQAPLRPAAHVNLHRYMGPWRVIACMDNKLERDFVDAEETYKLAGPGQIATHFEWREKEFSAPLKTHDFGGTVEPDGTNAKWKMEIFPLLKAGYVIIDVAPDYSYAAVANPSRQYGWILARQRTISPVTYRHLMEVFAGQGYDTSKFIRLPQVPGQVVHKAG